MSKQYTNLNEFKQDNLELFSQPIVNSFFKNDPTNSLILESSVVYGIEEATKELDKRFVEHFFLYRLIKYISTLAYHFSNQFDKYQRKQKKRFPLLIDQPQENDEGNAESKMLDYLTLNGDHPALHIQSNTISENYSIFELVTDEILYEHLKQLTKKEKKIIELLIIQQFKQIEVAKLLKEGPQSIAKTKKNALLKIKKGYIRS